MCGNTGSLGQFGAKNLPGCSEHPGRWVRRTESMCDSTADDQESIGAIDCPRIGVDAAGHAHYWDEIDDRVIETANGDVVQTHDLAGRPLDKYRQFVADRRGWALSGGDLLGDAIATVAGDR